MASSSPSDPRKQPDRTDRPAERGGDVRHIVDSGLPPGITPQDVIDPGSQPTEDRIEQKKK
ncbi:MAG TPA: hypothetical protein VGI70_21550 [Polyangiales bacterium]